VTCSIELQGQNIDEMCLLAVVRSQKCKEGFLPGISLVSMFVLIDIVQTITQNTLRDRFAQDFERSSLGKLHRI
jgi:hypothetical protein